MKIQLGNHSYKELEVEEKSFSTQDSAADWVDSKIRSGKKVLFDKNKKGITLLCGDKYIEILRWYQKNYKDNPKLLEVKSGNELR